MCLNARSIVNKTSELNIMVEDIDPHVIGIPNHGKQRQDMLCLGDID